MRMEFRSTDGHTRRLTVTRRGDSAGWEIRHEEDNRLIASVVYDDWHRVERARSAFAAEALSVSSRGPSDEVPD